MTSISSNNYLQQLYQNQGIAKGGCIPPRKNPGKLPKRQYDKDYGGGGLYGNSGQALQQMFTMFMTQMMQMMSKLGGLLNNGYNNNCPSTCNPPSYPPTEPPTYPPTNPPTDPPTYPPQEDKDKILGSAGLFGDPQFGLFSPGLGTIPNALKAFESNIKPNEVVTLLNDSDSNGLKIDAKGIQVDPNNAGTTGVGEVRLKSGNDNIVFANNGDLVVNGQVKGNIKSSGFIAPITLSSGAVLSTANEIDGAGGVKAERFVITNGDYKITAALRSPHADSANFYDMNFEEKKADAADNATGYQTSVPGLTQKFGIADLLKLEPGSLNSIA